MMHSKQEFLVRAHLERETLEMWIREEWLIPGESAGELTFSDAGIARAQLIRDLKNDLGVNDEGVGLILNLVDQVHGLRRVCWSPLRNNVLENAMIAVLCELRRPICLKAAV